jgi:hypothetical protein
LIGAVGVPGVTISVGHGAKPAITAAAIVIDNVAIVAFFPTGAEIKHVVTGDGITAASDETKVGTGVGMDAIVIVAILITFIVNVEVSANHTVTAAGIFTTVGAGVMINSVAIVTSFTAIKPLIAAASKTAIGVAAVTIHPITIVAGLKAGLSLGDIKPP